MLVITSPRITGRRYHRALRDKGFDVKTVPHGPDAILALLAPNSWQAAPDLLVIETPAPNDQDFEDESRMPSPRFFELLRGYLGVRQPPAIVLTAFPENSPPGFYDYYHIKSMLPHHTGATNVCWAAMGALGLHPQADASATGPRHNLRLRDRAA